ncbi:MAG: hypothetical protein A3A97_04335 [Candidatus Terrybacteria bacterium RIFCSPLOWO2_01_FULL_40_23]|uniref:Uncharacterized protein n=1 Tax=Candidatus Terrybacteria bacterium RIFCSPLOWO2_01_FULL_40_23 TaxID=1802366 RepID=A0A1G2PTI8_9BACT|nr:MAG: hypothetical protein A3A97_04335 [Candidatus Terrybacteria bacterium RIFCSPLOWO2_01_FULL_40_23]
MNLLAEKKPRISGIGPTQKFVAVADRKEEYCSPDQDRQSVLQIPTATTIIHAQQIFALQVRAYAPTT